MRSFSALCALALAATTAHALPEARAVQLGPECHNYPGFDVATGEAGPWPLFASDNDGPVARGVGSTESNVSGGLQAKYQINISTEPTLAKIVLKCSSGGLFAYDGTWTAVTRGPDDKAFLLVGHEGGAALQAHAHFLPDGTPQEGVFIGSEGKTTWAYKYQLGLDGRKEFRIRLLVNSDSLEEGEFKGYIRFAT